jgi:hypothetical protein
MTPSLSNADGTVLFVRGEYHVSIGVQTGDVAGTSERVFQVVHTRHDVRLGVTRSLAGAIQAAVACDKELQSVLKNPDTQRMSALDEQFAALAADGPRN